MGKGNIVYHNLRMNLDNEQHRRVHSVLAELNTDVHKSVNQFLIRREIKDELQREVIVTLGTALAGGKVIQMPQTVPERAVAEQTDREIETEADETTLGLASSWG